MATKKPAKSEIIVSNCNFETHASVTHEHAQAVTAIANAALAVAQALEAAARALKPADVTALRFEQPRNE